MVCAPSDKVPRASPYSGSRSALTRLLLQDFHLLRFAFPCDSYIVLTCLYRGPYPNFYWFGLLRFRSPLLTESISLSFPLGTKMFQFPRSLLSVTIFSSQDDMIFLMPGSPIRISSDHSLLPAPQSFSQVVASFFAF